MNTRKLTFLALCTCAALLLYWVESLLPPLAPIPGIKLGLANIVTLILLRGGSGRDAFLVLLTRILLAGLLFGQAVSLLYSLCGGLLCFAAVWVSNRLLRGYYLYLTAVLGAIFHNLGQMAAAWLLTSVPAVLSYLPLFLAGAVLTGLFTGLCASFSSRYLIPLLHREGL